MARQSLEAFVMAHIEGWAEDSKALNRANAKLDAIRAICVRHGADPQADLAVWIERQLDAQAHGKERG